MRQFNSYLLFLLYQIIWLSTNNTKVQLPYMKIKRGAGDILMNDATTLVKRQSLCKCLNQVAILVDRAIIICIIVVNDLSPQNSCNPTNFWWHRISALLMILRGTIKIEWRFSKHFKQLNTCFIISLISWK